MGRRGEEGEGGGWLRLSGHHIVPIHPFKEPVPLHSLCIILSVAEPGFHRALKQLPQQVLGIGSEVLLQLQLGFEHSLSNHFPIVAGEGGISGEHVVGEDSKAPPVNFLAMPAATKKVQLERICIIQFLNDLKLYLPGSVEYFRCHILHSSTECVIQLKDEIGEE